jgi:hypothetical protein
MVTGLGAFLLTLTFGVSASWLARGENAKDRIETERLALAAEYYLTAFFTQAVQLDHQGAASLNTWSSPVGQGRLRTFSGTSIASGMAGTVHTIAVFNREARASDDDNNPSGVSSSFLTTGVFYQMPTADTSGVLYLETVNPGLTVAPSSGGVKLDRIVEFEVTDPIKAANDEVLSARFRIVFRHFLSENYTSQGTWCPTADIASGTAGCNPSAYRDIVTNIQVNMRNNLMPSQGGGLNASQTTGGRIYFFRMLHPFGGL